MNYNYFLRFLTISLSLTMMISAYAYGAGTPAIASASEDEVTLTEQQDPPSPSSGKITISVVRSIESDAIKVLVVFPRDADELKVSLHNLIGSQVSINPITTAVKGEAIFQFDTRGLPNGPYFVVLEALGQRITKKIMLTR